MAPRMEYIEDDFAPDDEELEYEEMYSEIGYFISQYSTVELAITALLAALANFEDLEAFHTVTKGMDAKTKVERFKELAKSRNLLAKKGKFDERLIHFAEKVAGLRNKVAHTWILKSKTDPVKILFSNIAQIPFEQFKMKKRVRRQPDEILLDSLREYSSWLSDFQLDLLNLYGAAKKGAKLEIEKPNSLSPTTFLQRIQEQESQAKRIMRGQAPERT